MMKKTNNNDLLLQLSHTPQVDYYCFEYTENNHFFVVNVRLEESEISLIANQAQFFPELSTFSFILKDNLVISNYDDLLYLSLNQKPLIVLPNISPNVIRHWINSDKFYFKFVRKNNPLLLTTDIDDALYNEINIIGNLMIN